MVFLFLALLPGVMVLWVVALVRLNRSKLLEYMIIGDRLFSLIGWGMASILTEAFLWQKIIVLVVENIIIWGIVFIIRLKNRRKLHENL